MMEKCTKCGGKYYFSAHCGAHVCMDCDYHKGLGRCYCGWSLSGGDGRKELVEMGETIDPEPGIPGEGDDLCDPGPFPDSQPAYQEGEPFPEAARMRRFDQ